ncbi:MAG: amino acid permease [Endozoicomonas sp.]
MSDQSISAEKQLQSKNAAVWSQKDTGWMFSHVGTGIGAGLLYLPISAGGGGIWPLLLMFLVSAPMVFLTHRGLTRFCLSASRPDSDINQTVHEHFGRRAASLLMVICFFSMFPVLLLYTIGITNVSISYVSNQLNWAEPSRPLITFLLVSAMVAMFCGNEKRLLRLITGLVFPLAVILLGISIYLIPRWQIAFILQPVSVEHCLETFILALPVLVFSFYHAPVCSAFARSYLSDYQEIHTCIAKTDRIHFVSSMLLLSVTLFFVLSCVMTMTPTQLQLARQDNLPILSVLANQTNNTFFSTLAPLIAFTAILTSFYGFFLGVVEVMNGLLSQGLRKFRPGHVYSASHVRRISLMGLAVSCWIAGVGDWSVLAMMEAVVAPMMAVVLFFLPVMAVYRIDCLKRYRRRKADAFVVVVGLIVVTGFLWSLIL